MWNPFRRKAEHRRRVEAEADRLIAQHGENAWGLVYRRCRDKTVPEAERAFAYRVRAVIEARLGIPAHVDTATRYLRD